MTTKGKGNKKETKKKFSWKFLIMFIIFEIIFTGVTGPFLLYYGPFQNVKKSMVSAIMQTKTHQYLATTFLSKDSISKILNRDANNLGSWTTGSTADEQLNDVKISSSHDDTITRYDIPGKKWSGAYMLEIKDPSRIKVGYTKKLGKEGQRTSQIAENNNAIAAINGGGFTDKSSDGKVWAGTGGTPLGFVISNGNVIYNDMSENEKTSVMAMSSDGHLIVGQKSLTDLKKEKATQAIAFGPALIVNGQLQKGLDAGPNPRTAIGQKQDGTILLLVIDGRQGIKLGASLQDVQQIMHQFGAWNATNLDGGSSSTMYYDGEVISNPSDPLGERSVATAVYVER
ncbi:phosphodiester glycosidase family protein [Candidatus Clostridium radicumherbarum]|uniref:Phosphodiester glycosidase family protein n=1 Tax=Candidatus Clostridium radicumherbarum TaxID=3381662 RepID=A0ABW8TP92_9CLOT